MRASGPGVATDLAGERRHAQEQRARRVGQLVQNGEMVGAGHLEVLGVDPGLSPVLDDVAGLAQELAGRSTAHSDLHVNVAVHVGRAVVKASADAPGGKEVVGGELMSTADWTPHDRVDGVHVTPAARG